MEALTKLIDESTTPGTPAYVAPTIVGTVIAPGRKVLWQHAGGVGQKEGESVTADSVFWLASQSKLMCTVASLITVEKGLIGLDDDVSEILPDLAALEVLDGGEDADGIPTTKPRQNKITLSGVGYDAMPFSVYIWAQKAGLTSTTLDSTQKSMRICPLAFEPGTSWSYGAGIDWAGELFYKTNIWNPLGMVKSTYHPAKFSESIVLPYLRDETGELKLEPLPVPIEAPTETAGHGVWSTPNDYMKLLGALLDGGGPILSQKSVDEIFTPQCLKPDALMEMVQGPYKPALGPSIPVDQKIDHGLAGLINHTDFPGRRLAGALQWSGMPNLIWWVDRKTGIAATTFLQLMPVGDTIAGEFNVRFEEAVYQAFGPK
ncbi:related to beta-lactamase class C and other penicillin binding proteins [Phialocephala subalpina]|uniref:Related to beta-lactamase class C and other penicillin binding proteins n=1 Tax=Phialocephala subalpina TaxID=576137 RepID=A0A1L7XT62_9HELO|nr:related to beta-lactamase class C and other penicillin binding proteins [Phialocephala subalpina]